MRYVPLCTRRAFMRTIQALRRDISFEKEVFLMRSLRNEKTCFHFDYIHAKYLVRVLLRRQCW